MMMRTNHPISIRNDLLISLAAIFVILIGGLMTTMIFGARRSVRTMSGQLTQQTLRVATDQVDGFFLPLEANLEMFAEFAHKDLSESRASDEFIASWSSFLNAFPRVSSVILADEHGNEDMLLRDGEKRWRSRHINGSNRQILNWSEWSDDPSDIHVYEAAAETYDTFQRPWFVQAMNAWKTPGNVSSGRTRVYWTEPYEFHTTKEHGITASIAFTFKDGTVGVLAFDVLLRDLSRFTTNLNITPNGFVLILTSDDIFMAVPTETLVGGLDASSWMLKRPDEVGAPVVVDGARALREDLSERPEFNLEGAPDNWDRERFDGLREYIEWTETNEDEAPVRFESEGRSWWGDTRHVGLGANQILMIAVVIPEDDLLATIDGTRTWIAAVIFFVVLLAVMRAVIMARRVSAPIQSIVAQSDRISRGDLNAWEPIPTNVQEVRGLQSALERMREGLQSLFKLESDLAIAREIQQQTFPDVLPRVNGFDIAAWSLPADATGGDSYDVIGLRTEEETGERRVSTDEPTELVLLLADATGHGVGPALSVTQLRSMVRMAARFGRYSSGTIASLNEQLCEDLPEGRFITAWIGHLDQSSATLSTFSGGQGPMLLYRAATGDIEVHGADVPPLGVIPGLPIPDSHEIVLEPGDIYAVISDGIYEAENKSNELLGRERVEAILREHSEDSAESIIAALRTAAESWSDGVAQGDDQTVVLIKRNIS